MLRLELKTGSFVFLDDISITIGSPLELVPTDLGNKILKNIAVMISRGILSSNMTSSEVAGFIDDEKTLIELERVTGIVPPPKAVADQETPTEEISTDVEPSTGENEPEKTESVQVYEKPRQDNKRKKR